MRCWLGNGGGSDGGTDFTWTDGSSDLPTKGRYAQIQLVDIDGDSDLDLIAPEGNSNKGIQIYLGNGNTNPGEGMKWTLASGTNLASSGNWYGSNVYDINGDGALDIIAASWGDGIKAYLSSGGTTPPPDDTTPPSAITDLAVTDTQETSITITWTAPGDDGSTGTASEYDLRYAEEEITGSNWAVAFEIKGEKAPLPAGATETVQVTGLEQETTYYFAVITADEVPNWSPMSNSPSGTTKGTAEPALDVTIENSKSELEPGEDLEFDVEVLSAQDKTPVADASVAITSEDEDVTITPASGLTDSDGKLSGTADLPEVTTTTQVVLDFEITKDGYKTSKKRITVTVRPPVGEQKFDLEVTTANIILSHNNIVVGDELTIGAKIDNTGERDATGFSVKIFLDGTQLEGDETYTKLDASSSVTVTRTWTATTGAHTIRVEIHPNDSNLELESTDNTAEKSITVSEKEAEEDEGESMNWLWIIIIIGIVCLGVVYALTQRKKQRKQGD
jgi:hypothetical protein